MAPRRDDLVMLGLIFALALDDPHERAVCNGARHAVEDLPKEISRQERNIATERERIRTADPRLDPATLERYRDEVRRMEVVLSEKRDKLTLAEKAHAACKQREAAEAERAAAEEKAEAEMVAKLKADPRSRIMTLSARICWYEANRRAALDEIAKQKKYGKIGGVVSQPVIYRAQLHVRRADESVPPLQRRLRDLKAKPVRCAEPTLADYIACVSPDQSDDDRPEHCAQADFAAVLGLE